MKRFMKNQDSQSTKLTFRVKLFLISFGLFLSFLLLELLFRHFEVWQIRELIRPFLGQKISDCRRSDPVLHHVLIPNCTGQVTLEDYSYIFHTNSLGLRGEEISKDKPEGVYRVLVVGDSYVEGWGAEDNQIWTEVAKRNLQNAGLNVEIVNAGVASYSPSLELDWLRYQGMSLTPDLVIMMVDVNDVHDDFYYGGWDRYFKTRNELYPDSNIQIESWPPDEHVNFKRFISHSKVALALYTMLKGAADTHFKILSRESIFLGTSIFSRARDWDNYEKAFNLPSENIKLTKKFVEEKGTSFALTTTSRGAYHNGTEWTPGRTRWFFEEGKIYEPKPINIIKNLAESEEMDYIDIYSALQNSRVHPLYYSVDMHWTPEGQRVVGEAIAKYISGKMASVND